MITKQNCAIRIDPIILDIHTLPIHSHLPISCLPLLLCQLQNFVLLRDLTRSIMHVCDIRVYLLVTFSAFHPAVMHCNSMLRRLVPHRYTFTLACLPLPLPLPLPPIQCTTRKWPLNMHLCSLCRACMATSPLKCTLTRSPSSQEGGTLFLLSVPSYQPVMRETVH